MASISTPNTTGKYHDLNSYNSLINYITRPDKAIHGYINSIALDPYNPAGSMEAVARQYHKEDGVHVRHFILSFAPAEPITVDMAYLIGLEIINYLGQQFQAIYAVHEDKPHLHIHIVINAVSYMDGHKYRGTHEVFRRFKELIHCVLEKYGIEKLRYVPKQ